MSQKQPTSIVDKNGKHTTVHKNADVTPVALRLKGARPFQFTNTPAAVLAKQLNFVSDLAHDASVLFPEVETLHIGTDGIGEPTVIKATRTDGSTIIPDKDNADDVDGFNRALRNLSFSTGKELGYISDGSGKASFALSVSHASIAHQNNPA